MIITSGAVNGEREGAQLRNHNYVTEKRLQNNVTTFFQIGLPPIKISGLASGSLHVSMKRKTIRLLAHIHATLF